VVSPLRELQAAEGLPASGAWRVLDLGAGLGASSFGAALFASLLGVERLDVLAVDVDGEALEWSARLAPVVAERLGIDLRLRRRVGSLEHLRPEALGGRFDVVLVGLSLGEAGLLDDPDRAADWLLRWRSEALAPRGSLVLLEPALRVRSRAVQAVRDVLAARGERIFSPCPAVRRCPLLARRRDWCHEVARVPLPRAVATVGRRAGLREERLTWSQLVLRRDALRLERVAVDRLGGAPVGRLVSGPRPSKGKLERWACSEAGGRVLQRLARHAPERDPLQEAPRGSWVRLPESREERVRCIEPETPGCWSP